MLQVTKRTEESTKADEGTTLANGDSIIANGGAAVSIKTLTWTGGVLVGLVMLVIVQVLNISTNRFTSKDGLEVWKEIAAIKQELASMPKEVPAPWFKAQVDELKADLAALTRSVNEHNANHKWSEP